MASIFVEDGEEWVVDKLVAADQGKYIDWGTGTNTAVKGDSALQTPGGESRVAGAISEGTGAAAASTYRVLGTLTATGTKTIAEAGLFNTATTGTLIIRGDFTGVPVNANDKIEFTFDLEFQ